MPTWTEVLTQQKSYTITELIPNTQYTLSLNGVSDGTIEAYLGGTKIGEFVDNRITFTPSQPHTTLTIKTFGDLFLANIKLEKGNVAHKWTPAPEDKSIPKIRFFEYVKIISEPHEIDDSMLIKKQTIHLDDPSQNTIEVGVEVSSFTDKQLEANNTIKIIKSDYVTNEKMTNVITPITVQVSQIIQQADSIELSVSELRTDLENEIERVETESNAKIEANTEQILLEKTYTEERFNGVSSNLTEMNSSITILDNEINEEIKVRLSNAEGEINQTNSRVSDVESTTQTFTTRIANVEGELEEHQTIFRTSAEGATIGGTEWPTTLHADGTNITFITDVGDVKAQFGVDGMYVNRWQTDFHTIEKFEEGGIKLTIWRDRRSDE